jgi:hypothetical protein
MFAKSVSFSLTYSALSDIPRKHACSLQRRPSLAFDCGTFAYAKDQASLSLDGLLEECPPLCLFRSVEFGLVTTMPLTCNEVSGCGLSIESRSNWTLSIDSDEWESTEGR